MLCVALLGGCGSNEGIRINNQPFDAAPARLGVINDQWEVIFIAPTGGWQARFDTHRPMFNGREVFITLTSPDPDAFVTQALTDLHVLTPVASETAIDVYARVVPFTIKDATPKGLFSRDDKEENPPYALAASSDDVAPHKKSTAPKR